jgi:hypothetical protein
MDWPIVHLELGYWYANTFVNPRAKNFMVLPSTINESLDERNRK